MKRRQWLTLAGAAAITGPGWAQAAPNLNLVVPVPPGGSVDLTARLLGEHLPKVLKQNIVIENKPGASGSIAAAAAALCAATSRKAPSKVLRLSSPVRVSRSL